MSEVLGLKRRLLWRWHRSPLRRGSDMVEAWSLTVAWTLGRVGACLCAFFTAHILYTLGTQEGGHRHVVEARLLRDTRHSATHSVAGTVQAPLSRQDREGHVHTGTAAVGAGRAAGAKVEVWVGTHDNLVQRPVTRSEAAIQAYGGAAAAATGWCLLVAGGARLVRAHLDRERMSAWEADWRRLDRQNRTR